MKKGFLLCTDSNSESYYGMLNTITSLQYTNPGIPINIFYSSLTEIQKSRLKDCNLIQVDNLIDNSANRPDLGFGNYYRFYFNALTDFDKIIYLDNDIVALDSLENVFELNSNLTAVGRSRHISDDFTCYEKLQHEKSIDDTIWAFNTGFLCFDINFWKTIDILYEIKKLIDTYGLESFKNPVNCLMYLISKEIGGFNSLPKHYNYTVNNHCKSIERNHLELLAPIEDGEFVKILHWTGNIKYWHISAYDDFSNEIKLKMKKEGYNYKYIFHTYYPCIEQFLISQSLNKRT